MESFLNIAPTCAIIPNTSLVSCDVRDSTPSHFEAWSSCSFEIGYSDLSPVRSNGPEFHYSDAQAYNPYLDENVSPVQLDCSDGQVESTSRNASILDAGRWPPLASHPGSCETSGTDVTSTLAAFNGNYAPDGTPGDMNAPQSVERMQTALYPTFHPLSSTGYGHADLGTGVHIPLLTSGYPFHFGPQVASAFPPSDPVSSPHQGAFKEVENPIHDSEEPPASIVSYQTPRTRAAYRHLQRARAIEFDGLWIDKADLYAGVGQGNGMIRVHKCQWAMSTDPCGMWIIGSRPQVGAHIRRWHNQTHAGGTAKCLWGGCTTTRAMLTKSMNRHVVTVHFEEKFHCHGCKQAFSRKDVYDKHLEKSEVCGVAGAEIAYGTAHRVIDARLALEQAAGGDTVRYAGC